MNPSPRGRVGIGIRGQMRSPGESAERGEAKMTPNRVLAEEHKIIVTVLGAVERRVAELEAGAAVEGEWFGQLLEFLRAFVDRCHHGKEERHLFPALRELALPEEAAFLDELLEDHDRGRRGVAAAEAALQAPAGTTPEPGLAETLSAYAAGLRKHIYRENTELFALTDRRLSAEQQAEVAEGFERVEEELGAGQHEALHRLAEELAGER